MNKKKGNGTFKVLHHISFSWGACSKRKPTLNHFYFFFWTRFLTVALEVMHNMPSKKLYEHVK